MQFRLLSISKSGLEFPNLVTTYVHKAHCYLRATEQIHKKGVKISLTMIFNLGRETASGWTRHHRREILPGTCDSRSQKCPSYRPTNSSQVVKLTFLGCLLHIRSFT